MRERRMFMKKAILNYLKKYFNYWQHKTGFLPKVPFDGEFDTKLYVGEVDEYGYIQWMYQENTKKIDFKKWKREVKGELRKEIKEYISSYKFLELVGFLDGNLVCFKIINNDEERDLEEIEKCLEEIEKNANVEDLKELENCIEIGSYQGIFEMYFDNNNGNIVVYDFDYHKKTIIANTFQELFERLTPSKQ